MAIQLYLIKIWRAEIGAGAYRLIGQAVERRA